MNFVGKLFIILIFVMSLVFMSFAVAVYSTSNNWKETAKKVDEELKAAKAQVQQLTAKQTELQQTCDESLKKKGEEIAKLSAEIVNLNNEKDSAVKTRIELENTIGTAIATVQSTHKEIAESRGQLESLTNDFRKAQLDWNTLFTDFVKKTDEAHALSMKLSNLEAVSQELVKQNSDGVAVLKQFGLLPNPELYRGVPPYQVEGKITDVRSTGSNAMVEITVGSDSGLMKGHQLDVYRKAEGRDIYLGVVEVVLTEPNKAACRILPEYRKGTIQVDDSVTSEFSQERQKYQIKRDAHVATTR